jgi:hypothetical protein
MLVALESFSFVSFVIRQSIEGLAQETIPTGILLAAGAVVISVALTLAGLACKGQYSPLRLCLWLLAALLVVWLLVMGPFFIAAMIASSGHVPVLAIVGVVLSVTAISFGVLLPFLILSFANAFYRARLQDLLHLGGQTPPPVLAPPAPTLGATAEV